MDTITQMTLGAAVGEVTLGKKLGNKAPMWGAIVGLVPDLDVLAGPFMDTVSGIVFHRGVTHSIIFALLFAPILGYLIFRLYQKRSGNWRDWTVLTFWVTFTHPLLDNFTGYGTQFFWPFSDYRVALNTISVIDPLYTVPFLISIIFVLFLKRTSQRRRFINYMGIVVSSLYLLLTMGNKIYIENVFKKQLDEANIAYTRIQTSPTPLNNLLWRGVAEGTNGFWVGYYSLFDGSNKIEFDYIKKNHHLLDGFHNQPTIRKLTWLTNGYYAMLWKNGSLYLNDMRYGRMNGWEKFEGEFIFAFRLEATDQDNIYVYRKRPEFNFTGQMLALFARRMFGII
jgi:inner membrane protein